MRTPRVPGRSSGATHRCRKLRGVERNRGRDALRPISVRPDFFNPIAPHDGIAISGLDLPGRRENS
eukprot:13249779-Alexandrium_andersonii.AAC.1